MPIDVKMAWRNIWRNPRRTLLTICAIAFASAILVFMLSFQFGSYETMINSSVKIHTGHLQVQAEDYNDKGDIRLVVPDPTAIGRILDGTPGVEAYTYRANAFSMVSSSERTYGVIVVGIDPEREARVSTIKNVIRQGSYLSEGDADGVLVGEFLAKNLQVGPGDELIMLGQGRDGSVAATLLTVKGIYKSGLPDIDRSSIQITLENFQDVFSMRGAVHEVVVIGDSLRDIPAIKATVVAAMENTRSKRPMVALDWMELVPGLLQSIQMDLVSGMIFYLILIMVVAFSIMNTFLMAVFERTKEFGVLMAIGTTPRRLTKILLIESISLTMVGIVAGIILGCIITLYFQAHGIDFSGSSELLSQFGISGKMYPRLSVLSAAIGPALVLMITSLAALYPALRIRRLRPVEALSHT